jgi:glycolate oxidase iron-sulfur subunit
VTPEQLILEADRCVKCGLCLPHCPTYRLLRNEADSPRGRIALIQALADGSLPADPTLSRHLEGCLHCRRCESACPSGVAYGAMIDGARQLLNSRRSSWHSAFKQQLIKRLSQPRRLKKWLGFARLAKRFGLLQWLARQRFGVSSRLAAIANQIPTPGPKLPALLPTHTASGRSALLFTGCVSQSLEPQLIEAAIELLRQLGYAVEIPEAQHCCGALHRHSGGLQQAQQLCEHNSALFEISRVGVIATLASACHNELLEHCRTTPPIRSLVELLLEQPWPAELTLRPLPQPVLLHQPCSSRGDHAARLLQRIPKIQLLPVPQRLGCCGAAGSHLLFQPGISDGLGAALLEEIRALKAPLLVTQNSGCALQIRNLLQQAGVAIEVLHPLELILRQLQQTRH